MKIQLTLTATLVLMAAATLAAQTPATTTPAPDPQAAAQQTPSQTVPAADTKADTKPAPGTTPVGGDQAAPDKTAETKSDSAKPAPGTTPVGGDIPAPDKSDKTPSKSDLEKVVEVGSQKVEVKKGSIDDVDAVGNRDIGGRGIGNWYSTDSEIKMGRMYAAEVEKSTRFITDPVVTEYVNRIGQNIVKNSDCKVPFTIKVVDSDEINAFALPGGFFYVNSGLILNADEEAELAGVMAHETAHVCAHHAAREMTRLNYAQLGTIPLIFIGGWTGYGIYEAASIGIPITFMHFSREFEAQADYLGVQYMYRAGYDPQAFIAFFEKVQALEKRKPGAVAKVFADHPQTPDRIIHSQEEIARILPARDEYTVTTSEFNEVKARLARIENKRRLTDTKGKKPTLRKASSTDPNASSGGNTTDNNADDRPTLHRRDDQN
jgi:predicted Zn-dependent protease